MAGTSSNMGIKQQTKTHIKTSRVNGARKPNGGLLPAASVKR